MAPHPSAAPPATTPAPTGITITLGACVTAEEALTKFASQRAPAKTAYKLAKLLGLVQVEAAHFRTQHDAAVKTFGEPRQATEAELSRGMSAEVYQVPPAKMPEFIARVNEYAAVTTALAWEPLTLPEIEGLSDVTADDLIKLGPCLADEDGK